jgi:hypothetical protein
MKKAMTFEENTFDAGAVNSYNTKLFAELCSGSTKDFESFCPGSNPGSAAKILALVYFLL